MITGLIALMGFARYLSRAVYPILVWEIAVPNLGLATQSGMVEASAGVAAILAGLVLGRLADRFRIVKLGVTCSLLGGIFRLPQGFLRSLGQLIPLRFLGDFWAAGLDPILHTLLARRVPPQKRGTAFGLAGSAKALGQALGSFGGDTVAALFSIRAAFIAGSLCFGFLTLLIGLQAEGLRRPQPLGVMERGRLE